MKSERPGFLYNGMAFVLRIHQGLDDESRKGQINLWKLNPILLMFDFEPIKKIWESSRILRIGSHLTIFGLLQVSIYEGIVTPKRVTWKRLINLLKMPWMNSVAKMFQEALRFQYYFFDEAWVLKFFKVWPELDKFRPGDAMLVQTTLCSWKLTSRDWSFLHLAC